MITFSIIIILNDHFVSSFSILCSKAIAHYEQAADYYKGEESNRYSCSLDVNNMEMYTFINK